jgi:hypothetical protein
VSDLQSIPGVGPSIARDLEALGIHDVDALRGRDPQLLYDRLCVIEGTRVDPCVLYVFRCAVYFAETEDPDPHLLQWWRWKDRR